MTDYQIGPGVAFKFVTPIQYNYEPQPDITAYELAQLLPYFFGKSLFEEDWQALGVEVTRHLKRAAA